MTRPTPRDRQRVLEGLAAALGADGWTRLLSVSVTQGRPGRPVWGCYECDGLLYVWAQRSTRKRRSRRGWRVASLIDVRTPADGTGRGWHRRAAERIAATVRGWA